MKKTAPSYRMTPMISLNSPLIIDSYLGFRRVLKFCKRIMTEVDRSVLNGFKLLVKDSNIDNKGYIEFDTVAPIEELRILTSYRAEIK